MAARLDTISDAIEFLRLEQIENFSVRTSSDRDTTLIFKTDPEKTFEENLDRFRRVAEMTTGAFYIVETGNRGVHRIEVRNDRGRVVPEAQPATIAGVFGEEEVERRAKKMFEELKRENRLVDLEAENKELLREVNRRESIGERFMGKLEPYIGVIVPQFLNKFMPATAPIAIAGLEGVKENREDLIMTEEQEIRIGDAFARWYEADADSIRLLEKIAQIAASRDPMYLTAKQLLLNYSSK